MDLVPRVSLGGGKILFKEAKLELRWLMLVPNLELGNQLMIEAKPGLRNQLMIEAKLELGNQLQNWEQLKFIEFRELVFPAPVQPEPL
jgi:hypothetical protein